MGRREKTLCSVLCYFLWLWQETPRDVTEEEKKETEEEPQEEDKKEEETREEKEDESEKTKEQEEVAETKPKTRRSFRLFKRKQSDKKTVKDEEKVVASDEPEEENKETQEEAEKEENVEEEGKKESVKEDEKEDTQEQEVNEPKTETTQEPEIEKTQEPETEKTQEQEEMMEQASELNTKPKLRRSFNLFRKRPVSMSAADRSGTDKDEEKFLSRDDPIRHSYHAGDLPVPDPSNLRKYPHMLFWVWSYSQSVIWGRGGSSTFLGRRVKDTLIDRPSKLLNRSIAHFFTHFFFHDEKRCHFCFSILCR